MSGGERLDAAVAAYRANPDDREVQAELFSAQRAYVPYVPARDPMDWPW